MTLTDGVRRWIYGGDEIRDHLDKMMIVMLDRTAH